MTTITMNKTDKSLLMPALLLHLEGLAVLIGSAALYSHLGGEWGWFFLLLLVPDVSAVGYLANPLLGSMTYNLAHNYALPLLVGGLALAAGWNTGVLLVLIWCAHIGMDRLVGYGLKYPTEFKDTHLSRI